jgi:hypothetical protein
LYFLELSGSGGAGLLVRCEQYGRRSFIRTSGILEPAEEGGTTEKVRKIISDNIIRSHRVGKPDEQAAAVVKDRQIFVGLSDPGIKV